MNEAETCRTLVRPKLEAAGWGAAGERHYEEQIAITAGRVILVGGKPKRLKKKVPDFLLFFSRDILLAVVEAKSNHRPAADGLQQAKDYARILGLHFAYATNGTEIIEFDAFTHQETAVPAFPSPAELMQRYQIGCAHSSAVTDARVAPERTHQHPCVSTPVASFSGQRNRAVPTPSQLRLTDPRKIVAELRARWQPFPNTTTLGSYDYFSQMIELAAVSPEEANAAFVKKELPAQLKVFPLLAHEVQHLADNTATVWGRDLLIRLFEVYAVRASSSLDGYDRIPAMMRELRTIHFADYYTEYSDLAFEPSDGRRWSYQFSTGALLDASGRPQEDRPIVFTRFSRRDDEYICRVPFSVASLLEVRAMASEMLTATILHKGANGDPVAFIDYRNWADNLSAMFYEPLLAIYTVAAHCYANKTKTGSEPLDVFLGASALAWLALNLPDKMFVRLQIPDRFSHWGARNEALRANCDRGYLYLALVENVTQTVAKGSDPAPMLDAALRSAGLPSLDEVLDAVSNERKASWSRIAGSPFEDRLKDLLALGDEFAANEHLHPGRGYFLGATLIPPFLLADGSFTGVPSSTSPTGTFAYPELWLKKSHLLYLRLKEFFDACVA